VVSNRTYRLCVPAVVALAALAGGCSSGTPTYTVVGTVTFDGKAVAEGDVVFVPADGKTAPEAGKIKDGKFEMRARPGVQKVQIRAARAGKYDPVMKEATRVDYIPPRYNTNTVLVENVKPEGRNEFTFALRSR
jgi:hypothetical protein